jgi:hypothetical protein
LNLDDLRSDPTLVSEWVKMVKAMRGSHSDKQIRMVVALYLCLRLQHFPIDKVRLCEFLGMGIGEFHATTTKFIHFIEKKDTALSDRIVRAITEEKKQVSPFQAFGKTFSIPEQQQSKMTSFLNVVRREVYCKEESLCAAIASVIVKKLEKKTIAAYFGVNSQTIRGTIVKMQSVLKTKHSSVERENVINALSGYG